MADPVFIALPTGIEADLCAEIAVRQAKGIQKYDMSNEVTLPWPPRALSPNARTHWRQKSPLTKAYKAACWALVKESGMVAPDSPRIALWLDFFPPDRRARDDDNIVASFKAGRDGIAAALGIDDKRFVMHPYVRDKIGGYVRVRLTTLPERDE